MPNKLNSTKPTGIAGNQCEITLWFFPGNSEAMLGHVACEITETKNKGAKKTHYYSLLTEQELMSESEINQHHEEIARSMIDAEIGHYKTPNVIKTKFYSTQPFDILSNLITVATTEILQAAEEGSRKNNCAYYTQTILSIACPDKIPKPRKLLLTTPAHVLSVAKDAGGESSILPSTQFIEGMLHNTINSISNYLSKPLTTTAMPSLTDTDYTKKLTAWQQEKEKITTEEQCITTVRSSMLELNQAIKIASKHHSIKTNDQEMYLADKVLADKFVEFNNAVNKAEQVIYENKKDLKKQLGGLRYFFLEVANLFLKDRRCELLHKFRNVVTLARKDLQKSFQFEFRKAATEPETITKQPQAETKKQGSKEKINNQSMSGNIM